MPTALRTAVRGIGLVPRRAGHRVLSFHRRLAAALRSAFQATGLPIGLADDGYEERSLHLRAGDRLYLYSDGVPEAMDATGQQFGNSRLLEAISQGRSEPLQNSVADLLEEIARWHGSARPQDDISILAVEV